MKRTWLLAFYHKLFFVSALISLAVAASETTANSAILDRYNQIYSVNVNLCSSCHAGGNTAQPPTLGYGKVLHDRYVSAGVSVSGLGVTATGSIDAGIRAIEDQFAPFITRVNNADFSSASVELAAEQSSFTVVFDPGHILSGTSSASSSLSSFGQSGEWAGRVPSTLSTNITISVSDISLATRGQRRRANSPFTLNFDPINASGFKNTPGGANHNRFNLSFEFQNLAPVAISDSASPSANNTASNKYVLDVLQNDEDEDGPDSAMTVALISSLSGSNPGTLEVNATNDGFLYTVPDVLPTNPNEQTTFQYAPVDGEGLQGNTVTVTINIPEGLNPPVAQDDTFTFDEDTTLNGDVKADNGNGPDSDPEGLNTVTFEILNAPSRLAAFNFNTDGTFSYTPLQDDTGTLTFSYRITDGTNSDIGQASLNISPVNDDPVAVADSFVASASNDSSNKLELSVLNNDSDVDHASGDLSVTLISGLTGASPGTLELNAGGTGFLYTVPNPLPAAPEQTTFEYAPLDGDGAQGNTVTVTVSIPAPSATPPVAQDDSFTFDEDTDLAGDVRVDNGNGADSDPDGLNTVTFSVLNQPARGILNFASDGTFDYSPQANDNGTLTFSYQADDGTTSDVGTVSLTISAINDAPEGAEDRFVSRAENDSSNKLELDVLNNDTDVDHAAGDLTVALATGLTGTNPGTLELNAGGTGFLYTVPDPLPATAQQTTFTYIPRDADSLAGSPVTVTIDIPANPGSSGPIAQDDSFAFDEDTVLTGDLKADNGNGVDADPDGLNTLTYSVFNAPPTGAGALALAPDGTFTFTPTENENGTVSFEYIATDGTTSSVAAVTLNINPINDAPEVDTIALSLRTENEASFTVDLLDPAFVNDVDGDTLTVSNVQVNVVLNETDNDPVVFQQSDLFNVSGSQITFSPTALADLDEDESADITVNYDVSDGTSAALPNTLTQSISGLDNGLGRLAGLYADSISSRYNGHFGGLNEANGSCHTCHVPGQVDADVDSVDECIQTPRVFNDYGLTLCLNRDRNTPALADLERRMSEAEPEFAPRLNPAVGLAIDETATAGEAIGAPLTAASTGKTVDGVTAEIVEYLIVANGAPSGTDASGQFVVDESGQMRVAAGATLTPGQYNFVVLPVNDAGQKDNSGNLINGKPGFYPFSDANQTAFTVQVNAILPQTTADTGSTLQDTPLTLDVTANDTAGRPTSLAISTPPASGSAVVNADLTVTYTPSAGFTGTETFAYTASNAQGASAPANVTVTVLANGSVIARDDQITTLAETATRINVLANDDGAVTTGPNSTVIQIVTAPDATTVGTLQIVDQDLEFTSVAGFTGQANAVYSATNPGGTTTNANVTITVLASGGTTISDALDDPELKKVAQSLEQSCGMSSDPEFLEACVNITAAAANAEDLTPVMQALRNEEHFATVDTAQTIARTFGRSMQRRIQVMRSGGPGGFDISGLNVSINGEPIPSQFVKSLAAGALGFSSTDPVTPLDWSFFVAGDVSISDKDATGLSSGFDTKAVSMMVGAEFKLDEKRDVGFALGYTSSDTDYTGGGSLDSEAFQASVYGRIDDALGEGIDFDGYLSFGKLNYESDRRILFTANGTTVDSIASAKFDGTYINIAPTLSFSEQLGRYGDALGDWKTGTELRWRIGLDYLRLEVDDYTETGGAGLALSTQSEAYESLQLFVGVDAKRPIWLGPRARSEIRGGLTVYGELLDEDRTVTSSFAAAGAGAPTFTVTEPGSSGLGGTLDLGLTIDLSPGVVGIDYSYDYSTNGVRTQSLGIEYLHTFGRRAFLKSALKHDFSDLSADEWTALLEYSLRF